MSQHHGSHELEAMSFASNYHTWIFTLFQPFVGKHVVEVGAGTGNFSKILLTSTKPASFVAVEPSANLFPLLERNLQDQLGCKVVNAFFSDIYRSLPQKPDTIFYINVLEHIVEDAAELSYAHEALEKNGHVCIFVPALAWLYGTSDKAVGHVRRYYKKQLQTLLQTTHFEMVKVRYFDIVGIIAWWTLFCLLKVDTIKTGQVTVYDKIVVPIMQRIEKILPPPIGKNIMIVGRKT